eukprot:6206138-Pleurochrysis_carterae.AAC.7
MGRREGGREREGAGRREGREGQQDIDRRQKNRRQQCRMQNFQCTGKRMTPRFGRCSVDRLPDHVKRAHLHDELEPPMVRGVGGGPRLSTSDGAEVEAVASEAVDGA